MILEDPPRMEEIKYNLDNVNYHWSVSDTVEFLYDKVKAQEAELAKMHNLITGRTMRVKVNLLNSKTHTPIEIALCNVAVQFFQAFVAEEMEKP